MYSTVQRNSSFMFQLGFKQGLELIMSSAVKRRPWNREAYGSSFESPVVICNTNHRLIRTSRLYSGLRVRVWKRLLPGQVKRHCPFQTQPWLFVWVLLHLSGSGFLQTLWNMLSNRFMVLPLDVLPLHILQTSPGCFLFLFGFISSLMLPTQLWC